jgi:hypothetical protein
MIEDFTLLSDDTLKDVVDTRGAELALKTPRRYCHKLVTRHRVWVGNSVY